MLYLPVMAKAAPVSGAVCVLPPKAAPQRIALLSAVAHSEPTSSLGTECNPTAIASQR
jgi:hypothetical protein